MKRSYEKASQIFLTELPALNTGGRKDLKYFVMAPGCCSKQELRITNFFVSVQRNEGPESAVFAKTRVCNSAEDKITKILSLSELFKTVLLQSWAESSEDSVSHSLMAAACGRSQAVSNIRLTITASGFGCP